MNPSRKSFLSSGTVVVPAGATVPYNCTGQLFICKEATAPFWMSFNDGEFFKHEVGLGFRLKGEDFFRRLQFRNDSASAITIEFYAGVGEVVDNRLNTVIDRLIVVSLKDITDIGVGYSSGLVVIPTFGSSVTLSATSGTGKQRKQVVITNTSAVDWILILDSADHYFAAVAPLSAWTMQTSAVFKLTCFPANGPINALIGQTYYTS